MTSTPEPSGATCRTCRSPLRRAARFCSVCGKPVGALDVPAPRLPRRGPHWSLWAILGIGFGVPFGCMALADANRTRQAEARAVRDRFVTNSRAQAEAAWKRADSTRMAGDLARTTALIPTLTPAEVHQLPDSDLNVLWNLGPGRSTQAGTLPRGAWWAWVDRENDRREARRRAPAAPLAHRPATSTCLLSDGSAAPGYARLVANVWEGQRLYRTTTCDYVADVVGVDADGDVVLRTRADGDVDTWPRALVQAQFVTDAR